MAVIFYKQMFEKYFHFRIRCGIILEKANTCSENMFGHNRSEDKGDFYLSDMKEE